MEDKQKFVCTRAVQDDPTYTAQALMTAYGPVRKI